MAWNFTIDYSVRSEVVARWGSTMHSLGAPVLINSIYRLNAVNYNIPVCVTFLGMSNSCVSCIRMTHFIRRRERFPMWRRDFWWIATIAEVGPVNFGRYAHSTLGTALDDHFRSADATVENDRNRLAVRLTDGIHTITVPWIGTAH